MTFFLVWDKGNYTGSFLVIFTWKITPTDWHYNPKWFISCNVLHSILVSFLMVVSAGLRFLYSFLYMEYINHIQVFSFLLLPYPSCAWSPIVWPVLHNIATFVLGLYSKYIYICIKNMWLLAFWALLTSLKVMFSSSIHLPVNAKITFFFLIVSETIKLYYFNVSMTVTRYSSLGEYQLIQIFCLVYLMFNSFRNSVPIPICFLNVDICFDKVLFNFHPNNDL
jgi:hypothetical protein